MALVRDRLWGIVSGTETALKEGSDQTKFLAHRDHALTTIVLAVNPSLLYLLGDPEDSGRSYRINSRKKRGRIN